MSKTRETALWKWLRGAISDIVNKNELHWQRIENAIDNDTPDVEGCFKGVSFVIELKTVERVAQLKQKLTPGQALFLHSRWMAGGSSWLLVQVGHGLQAPRRYLLPGNFAPDIFTDELHEPLLNDASIINPCDPAIEVLYTIYQYGRNSPLP